MVYLLDITVRYVSQLHIIHKTLLTAANSSVPVSLDPAPFGTTPSSVYLAPRQSSTPGLYATPGLSSKPGL